MFQTIAIVLGVLAVLVLAILAYAATRPDEFRFSRSKAIIAPPETIFSLINDYHNWASWSPYEKLDPNMKRTYKGAPSGKGAVYEWEGNGNVGRGRMEIKETVPPSRVTIQLDFIKPFEGHNIAEFTLEPQGDSTNVTWAMSGRYAFMMKVMKLFMNMDCMIGNQFEEGLTNLKTITEKQGATSVI
jgi:uncharacterized protein YndB with AHSA1/START domain